LIHAEGYAASLMPPIHNFGLYLRTTSPKVAIVQVACVFML
jgi:hypothetical protein